jgi:hypothetical protein
MEEKRRSKLWFIIKIGNNFNVMLIVAFFLGVLLIGSTYAWLSSTLDVRINFLNLTVSNDSGLSISLDGITFGESVMVSEDILMNELKATYPNHTTQWCGLGLFPISTIGIKNPNAEKFHLYGNSRLGTYNYEDGTSAKLIDTHLMYEIAPKKNSVFVAFDLFLRNNSGSPMPDNLYFRDGTGIFFDGVDFSDYDGVFNSLRLGMLKIGTTSKNADPIDIQNVKCDNKCESIIYEPNSTAHSEGSRLRALEDNIVLYDGVASKTFAIIDEGRDVNIVSGQPGTGVPLDLKTFQIQDTITNFNEPIFEIPNGITKFRVYVWVEGQDVDSLNTKANQMDLSVVINFYKDIAGYEYYND